VSQQLLQTVQVDGVWQIDGRKVDAQLALRPETQTYEQLHRESDTDLRVIRISRWAGADKSAVEGWTRYLTAAFEAKQDLWSIAYPPGSLFDELPAELTKQLNADLEGLTGDAES
jgi:hypothetical protein